MSLSTDRNTPERDGRIVYYKVAANTKIFAGSLVALNSNGFAVPATNTVGMKGVGRAEDFIDNTSGNDGDLNVPVKKGIFKFNNDTDIPIKGSDIMADCYIRDDETVRGKDSGASAPNPIAGNVFSIDDDGVWVKF